MCRLLVLGGSMMFYTIPIRYIYPQKDNIICIGTPIYINFQTFKYRNIGVFGSK